MTNGEKFKEVFGFGADGSRVIAVNTTWWDCEFQNRKPITNADRHRALSDEEIATFIVKGCQGRECPSYQHLDASRNEVEENCRHCWLDWLKSLAEEGE